METSPLFPATPPCFERQELNFNHTRVRVRVHARVRVYVCVYARLLSPPHKEKISTEKKLVHSGFEEITRTKPFTLACYLPFPQQSFVM